MHAKQSKIGGRGTGMQLDIELDVDEWVADDLSAWRYTRICAVHHGALLKTAVWHQLSELLLRILSILATGTTYGTLVGAGPYIREAAAGPVC